MSITPGKILSSRKEFSDDDVQRNFLLQLTPIWEVQHEQHVRHAALNPEFPPPSLQNSSIHILPETPPCSDSHITTMPDPKTVLPHPRPQGSHGRIAQYEEQGTRATGHAITDAEYALFRAAGRHGPLAWHIRETHVG